MKGYRRGTWILLAGLLVILSGCTDHSQYRGVQNNLDKALYYYEVDRQNQPHAISDECEMCKSVFLREFPRRHWSTSTVRSRSW